MSSTKAAVEPATCSATATAASLADAIITALRITSPPLPPAPATRAPRSGAERGERVGPPNELIGLGADHVSVVIELPVEQEAAHVAGAAQERDEPLAREPLRHVATRVHQVAQHGPYGGIARPYEERPAPVPPAAQVLARRAARGRPPEHEEPRGTSERVLRRQRTRGRPARPRGLHAAAGGEVDLDDFRAAGLLPLLQGARRHQSRRSEVNEKNEKAAPRGAVLAQSA